MTALAASRLVCICGGLALAAIAAASLMPAPWVLRTGLPWMFEHFVVFFAVTAIMCVAYLGPFLVATLLLVFAGLLEALQGLTLDRTPDLLAALSGSGGVLTAALLVWLVIRVWKSARHGAYDTGCEQASHSAGG